MPRPSVPCALAFLPALAGASAAQSFAHNKVEFGNWWITDREDLFPNYASASGNVAGDGLFKVFPAEIVERGGTIRISGYRIAISVDDAYTGAFPVQVQVPAVQFYRTKVVDLGGVAYEVPDLARPVGPRYDPVPVDIPADGAWVVEVAFRPTNSNPRTRALLEVEPEVGAARTGLAMMALARAGERRAPDVPGVVLQSTFAERHFAPGRPSHSGAFDARTGTIAMFGTSGMPSATGELYFGVRFHDPTLQLAGPSAGGVIPDPQGFETGLGPGAYATDLASRRLPGHVRFYVQAEQFDPAGGAPTHLAFPFVVALGAAGPTAGLPVGGTTLRIDPAALGSASVLVDAGFFGVLQRIPAASGAGFDEDQFGAWSSSPLPVPPSPALRGAQLWIQALVTTVGLTPAASTNVVRLVL